MVHYRLFFFIFIFSTVNSKFVHIKILPKNGFEPRTSDTGSDRSASWATACLQLQSLIDADDA